ncbi:MAG: hypothetical protein JWM46_785 [Candidatus Kaiserbacteria bacterium]|nr:hypothetical protein [Candidatus Kaiserbacteria bacterium]
MILAKGLVEAPVLDALFDITPLPRIEHALRALENPAVQKAMMESGTRMRQLARSEDEQRAIANSSPVNYRRFYVSCVAIGLVLRYNASAPYEWWAFVAANSKPSKKACKFCAEMRIVRAAREMRVMCIGGLLVLGERQPDARSGKLRNTLNPCPQCRDMMKHPDNRYLFRQRTLIMTSMPESQVQYMETLTKMYAAHGEQW